jgi:integrase
MPKKRANGEGSIRKRKDGRWEGFYTAAYDPVTGKQKIKNVLGKTQNEVKEKLKKAIADSQQLDMNRSGSHTVKTWVKMWYEVYAEPRLREKTKEYYLNYIDNHIIPRLGDIKLDKLTTIQIQKFYNDLQKNGRVQRYKHIELKDKGLSVRVVRGIHTLLNNCLEQAVAERLILVNPAHGCKLPKLEKREMKVLPEEKIKPYLMEAEKRGLLAAYYLELTTGLRRGELLALLWTDLDVEKKTISITKQVNRIKGELVVSQPKTQNSVRVLPVSQQAVDLLIEEHKKHPRNPYMFPSPKTGTMFDPDSFRHTHDKILKAIGAEHIRFHDLRHTFATLSLKNGVDVKTLSGALGHYSAGFTLSTYTHATAEMKRDAADTIGDVISKAM